MQEQRSVWVVSYPKSGNTWVRTLLRNYVELQYGHPPMETSDCVPYSYHTVSPYPVSDLDIPALTQLRPAAMMHLVALCHSRQKPAPINIIKTHAAAHAIGGVPMHSPLWMNYAIYVYRDPRDILPSYADHTGKSIQDTIDMMGNEAATIGKAPEIPSVISSWSEHVESWLDYELVRPLPVAYERLHKEPQAVLKEMILHCGLELAPGAVMEAVSLSKFSKLQEGEAKQGFYEKSQHQKKFFRRGIVGSHKDEVSEHQVKILIEDHHAMMERLRYV